MRSERFKKIAENTDILSFYSQFLLGKLKELQLGLEISALLDEVNGKKGYIATTDVDKLIRIDNDYRIGFEMKFSSDRFIFMKYSHYNSLKLISEKLGADIYVITKEGDSYFMKKIEDGSFNFKTNNYGKTTARIKIDDMQKMGKEEFKEFLAGYVR